VGSDRYKPLKRTIRTLAAEWEPRLDLPGILVAHRFHNKWFDDDNSDTTVANTVARWEYREAVIHWYLPSAVRLARSDLEMVLVHEYVHVLLGPIRESIPGEHMDRLELATESVCRALLKTIGLPPGLPSKRVPNKSLAAESSTPRRGKA